MTSLFVKVSSRACVHIIIWLHVNDPLFLRIRNAFFGEEEESAPDNLVGISPKVVLKVKKNVKVQEALVPGTTLDLPVKTIA